jgi:hypothetical protein
VFLSSENIFFFDKVKFICPNAEIDISGFPIITQTFMSDAPIIESAKTYYQLLSDVINQTIGKFVLISNITRDSLENFKSVCNKAELHDFKELFDGRLGLSVLNFPFTAESMNSKDFNFAAKLFDTMAFANTFEEADDIATAFIGIPFL